MNVLKNLGDWVKHVSIWQGTAFTVTDDGHLDLWLEEQIVFLLLCLYLCLNDFFLFVCISVCMFVPWSQRFSFAVKRRDKREKEVARENLWLQVMRISLSCYNRCQLYITRSINKQPIATHLPDNNSQSEYAVRFLQSGGRVRS